MARPRSFDVETVLDAASTVFRRLGYEAASVDDLVAATGLHRGSLYGAFGSKRGLFVAALRASTTRPNAADAVSARSDLGDDALDLVIVAALELAPRDDEVRDVVATACAPLDARVGGRAGALGARLLRRAGLDPQTSPTTTPTGRSA